MKLNYFNPYVQIGKTGQNYTVLLLKVGFWIQKKNSVQAVRTFTQGSSCLSTFWIQRGSSRFLTVLGPSWQYTTILIECDKMRQIGKLANG